jgi:hypothetical protein
MDIENEDNTPIRHDGDENRQVNVWSPEDAARFLSSAIQQTQRPLTDALNKRSVSPGIFALVIVLLVAAAAACGWVLLDRLEKTEKAADNARNLREQALVQQHEIKSKHDVVSAKLSTTQEQLERVRRDLETENERLRTEATGFRLNEEEMRRLKNDIQRYRRHNELLRNQISGLEMEKQALGRQLSAVKAMAAGDDDLFDAMSMDELDAVVSEQPPHTEDAPAAAATVEIAAPAPTETAPSPVVDSGVPTSIPEEAEVAPTPEQPEETTVEATEPSAPLTPAESFESDEPAAPETMSTTPDTLEEGSTSEARSSIRDNENAL